MIRVIVCGTRDWTDVAAVHRALDVFADNVESGLLVVVHGDCPTGADRIAREWCAGAGAQHEPHPADWKQYGKSAGPIRNREMAYEGAKVCLAFWDGASRGTFDMIAVATQHGIPVRITPKAKI